MVGDYTENLEKPQNGGWALARVWVLARDNMVYQLVGLHLVGIIFHILTGSCHNYITGSCKKLYNKLHCLHCLLITTQTNNIAPVYNLWFTITTLLLQLYI